MVCENNYIYNRRKLIAVYDFQMHTTQYTGWAIKKFTLFRLKSSHFFDGLFLRNENTYWHKLNIFVNLYVWTVIAEKGINIHGLITKWRPFEARVSKTTLHTCKSNGADDHAIYGGRWFTPISLLCQFHRCMSNQPFVLISLEWFSNSKHLIQAWVQLPRQWHLIKCI